MKAMSSCLAERFLSKDQIEASGGVVNGAAQQIPARDNAVLSEDLNGAVQEKGHQTRSLMYSVHRKRSAEQNGRNVVPWIQTRNAYDDRIMEENESEKRDLDELDSLKSGEKLSCHGEESEQEDSFTPEGFPHPSLLSCLDLSLKRTPSPNAFQELDCIVNERSESIDFTDTSSKRNISVSLPRLVSRPCSILASAGIGDLTETDKCNVQGHMSNNKLFEECNGIPVQRIVNVDGWKNQPSSHPSFVLSRFPVCYYGCVPDLEKSEEAGSMSEIDELKQKTAHGRSRNSGFRALDLLVRAIQVTTGYLLGDEDDDFPESPSNDNLHPKHLAGERKFAVKKRVLRRARSAFKKPLMQDSVTDNEPKRGRKRNVSELHHVGDTGLKFKLSIIGAQTTFEDEVKLMGSKRRRSQVLPTKFYDSMVQTWRRKSKRQLKLKL